jgi:hypothetical protein
MLPQATRRTARLLNECCGLTSEHGRWAEGRTPSSGGTTRHPQAQCAARLPSSKSGRRPGTESWVLELGRRVASGIGHAWFSSDWSRGHGRLENLPTWNRPQPSGAGGLPTSILRHRAAEMAAVTPRPHASGAPFVRPSNSVKLQSDRAQVCAAQCPGLAPRRPCSQVAEFAHVDDEDKDVVMRPPIVGFIIHHGDRVFAPSPPFPRTHSRFRLACEACCSRRLWAVRQVYCRAMRNGFAGSI